MKSTPLQARDMCCDARITSGTVAVGDALFASDIHAADLAGMNISGVVSAGSWSRPGVDSLTVYGNGHRVLGFDALNVSPAKAVSAQWINNVDSIISNNDVWAMQDAVENNADCCTSGTGYEGCCSTAVDNRFDGHQGQQYVNNPSTHNTGARSKDVTVTLLAAHHAASLTQGAINV